MTENNKLKSSGEFSNYQASPNYRRSSEFPNYRTENWQELTENQFEAYLLKKQLITNKMSISKTILIGALGKAPTIGKTQNGKDYANFSLATSKKWKDENGEKQEKTSWHNISCWGSLVKVCQYLDKGSKIYLEGELEYGTYKNKENVEVPSTKIIASVIDIIKGKEEIDKHSTEKSNGYAPQAEDFNDEIPF